MIIELIHQHVEESSCGKARKTGTVDDFHLFLLHVLCIGRCFLKKITFTA